MDTKVCSQCGEAKSLDSFYRVSGKSHLLKAACKHCTCKAQKDYVSRNHEKLSAQKKEYRARKAKETKFNKKVWYEANKERCSEKCREWRISNQERVLLNGAKNRAEKRGIPFNLELEDINIPEYCPVLGLKLEIGKGKTQPNSPSLDRLVPSLGYVKGNILVVSHRANQIKNDASIDEVKRVLRYMERYQS